MLPFQLLKSTSWIELKSSIQTDAFAKQGWKITYKSPTLVSCAVRRRPKTLPSDSSSISTSRLLKNYYTHSLCLSHWVCCSTSVYYRMFWTDTHTQNKINCRYSCTPGNSSGKILPALHAHFVRQCLPEKQMVFFGSDFSSVWIFLLHRLWYCLSVPSACLKSFLAMAINIEMVGFCSFSNQGR